MLITFALNDLPKGAELFTNYVAPTRSLASRSFALKHSWNFECYCELCESDRDPSDRPDERAALCTREWDALRDRTIKIIGAGAKIGNMTLAFSPPQKLTRHTPVLVNIVQELKAFATKLETTYKPGRTSKLDLSNVNLLLGDVWYVAGEYDHAREASHFSRDLQCEIASLG